MDKIFEPFIWSFKRGDDLTYNYQVLQELVLLRNNQQSTYLNKPITIFIASIIECVLYDFLQRILQSKNGAHVPQLSPDDINKILEWQGSKPDLLEKVNFLNLIEKFKKHKILGDGKDNIYAELKEICTDRNRIHIQDQKKFYPRDDVTYWTTENCNKYLDTFYKLCGDLIKYHCRWSIEQIGEYNNYIKMHIIDVHQDTTNEHQ